MSGRRREELHQEKFYVECLTAVTLSHRRNIQIINLFCSYPRIEKSNLRISYLRFICTGSKLVSQTEKSSKMLKEIMSRWRYCDAVHTGGNFLCLFLPWGWNLVWESELWTRLAWILWGCFLGMRPSVWYRIQDDQVMIFKKINEQGNHLVPCAWSWMNLVMRWGRNVIMTICSIGYYRMMLRVLGVSMLIANSSLLKGDRQPATPKAIFHSQVSLPLFRHTACT